ncbi:aldo/keto reductase [Lichenifustis flavocetrariae]|uniref:Aldo/keto reductase n=1 Tax=Lichenifustis flavocetrariae TaxID=2949735 RepID=A0AA42CM14_9HYPH|nr:aldo/keto reductase [Lichenifustis flavocetrariae]MCW6512199.1 aldo/keto reductase [Lichenifustis flavocetrariae]
MTSPTPLAAARAGTYKLGERSVARMGYGAMQLRKLASEPAKATSLLERAVALGVDHFDTAQFYGDGAINALIGRVARSNVGVTVASKIGADPNPGGKVPMRPAQRPEQLRASVEDNLRSLGLDHIPVVNLRRLDVGPGLRAEGDQVVDVDDQLAAMIALRSEGKIGAIGLSAVSLATVQRAIPARIACVQNAYSLVNQEFEDVLALCRRENIAWVPFFPLGGAYPGMPKVVEQPEIVAIAGELGVTPTQLGLIWLLAHAPNILLIPGTADRGHLEENIAAAAMDLPPDVLAKLDAFDPPPPGDIAV